MKGQLTESELTQLKELIENLEISTSRTNSVCADCFEYNLEIETGGKKMIVNADDISIPDSGAGELVMFLQELIDFELK